MNRVVEWSAAYRFTQSISADGIGTEKGKTGWSFLSVPTDAVVMETGLIPETASCQNAFSVSLSLFLFSAIPEMYWM